MKQVGPSLNATEASWKRMGYYSKGKKIKLISHSNDFLKETQRLETFRKYKYTSRRVKGIGAMIYNSIETLIQAFSLFLVIQVYLFLISIFHYLYPYSNLLVSDLFIQTKEFVTLGSRVDPKSVYYWTGIKKL